MSRLRFPVGEQKKWLENILDNFKLRSEDLAIICSVSTRTIRDWRREKFLIQQTAAEKLQSKFKVPLPSEAVSIDNYWYISKGASLGGRKHVQLYGAPGTVESRRKGGHISQIRRKEHPELYTHCKIAKNFVCPEKSAELAELFGIILGDGGISLGQLTITLNRKLEQDYINFVDNLLTKLFSEKPKRYVYDTGKDINVCRLSLTGVNLIKYLDTLGLAKGNKVIRQVKVPTWIETSKDFSIACLRGLVDTDGGIYHHIHKVNGIEYFNLGFNFSNMSLPLIDFVHKTLTNLGFNSRIGSHGVYLYRQEEVLKYAEIVGFSNSHHREILKQFNNRKGVRVV